MPTTTPDTVVQSEHVTVTVLELSVSLVVSNYQISLNHTMPYIRLLSGAANPQRFARLDIEANAVVLSDATAVFARATRYDISAAAPPKRQSPHKLYLGSIAVKEEKKFSKKGDNKNRPRPSSSEGWDKAK